MAYIQANKEAELPNLINQEIWQFIGDRGVYCASPDHMLSNFDVFVHSSGNLFYRMKLKKDVLPVNSKTCSTFFEGVEFYDPMECFISRTVGGDEVNIMPTHYRDDIDPFSNPNQTQEIREIREAEELENETSISFERFLSLKLI